MNKELAKTLTTALVQFIDNERPEGTMDCSSGECVSLEKAFVEENFDSVEALINKKLSRLTEFEESLRQIIVKALSGETPNGSGGTMSWAVALSDDDIKKLAPELLALAKKELARRDEIITLNNMAPYDKGLQDGKAEVMTNLEKAVIGGDVNNIPKWLVEELNKAFKKGQAEKDLSWHPSTEHPPVDEEVIVLLGNYDDLLEIAFGHIVDKDIAIDYNGWNIPGVRYWMPMPEIPKEGKK